MPASGDQPLPDLFSPDSGTVSKVSKKSQTKKELGSRKRERSGQPHADFQAGFQAHTQGQVALVVEENQRISQVLEQLGWRTRCYHPRALASTDKMALHRQIHEGKYQLVCCDLPSGLGCVPPNKMNAVLREMSLWVRTAKEFHDCNGLILGPRSRL